MGLPKFPASGRGRLDRGELPVLLIVIPWFARAREYREGVQAILTYG
jgi:hypothetical protein